MISLLTLPYLVEQMLIVVTAVVIHAAVFRAWMTTYLEPIVLSRSARMGKAMLLCS